MDFVAETQDQDHLLSDKEIQINDKSDKIANTQEFYKNESEVERDPTTLFDSKTLNLINLSPNVTRSTNPHAQEKLFFQSPNYRDTGVETTATQLKNPGFN